MNVRNLDYIRQKDPRLYEALSDILQGQQNISQQTNANESGEPYAPPAIQGLKVNGQNGHFQFAIQDEGSIYRDVRYFVEHADNPQFTNPHVIELGAARNGSVFLGNVSRYWRAYSAYGSSPAGSPVYHGSPTAPLPVTGGGSIGGPAFLDSEGSGTGARGQGLSGPGPVPFRSATGVPPARGVSTSSPAGTTGSAMAGAAVGLPQGANIATTTPTGGGTANMQYVTVTQAGLAALAATLNNGSQVTAYVSDYDHTMVWTGSGWRFASGERSGYVQGFLVDPFPTTGWQLCDGSATDYLITDGNVSAYNTPDLTSATNKAAYLKFGSPATGVPVAAIAPTLTMDLYTPTGTVSQPILTMNSYTPTGTVSQPIFSGNALAGHQHQIPFGFDGAYTTFRISSFGTSGTGTIVASYGAASTGSIAFQLTQSVSGGTPSGTVSQPTFSGNAATLTGTVSATAEPRNLVLRPWFRR